MEIPAKRRLFRDTAFEENWIPLEAIQGSSKVQNLTKRSLLGFAIALRYQKRVVLSCNSQAWKFKSSIFLSDYLESVLTLYEQF